jgi:hypothetical protein
LKKTSSVKGLTYERKAKEDPCNFFWWAPLDLKCVSRKRRIQSSLRLLKSLSGLKKKDRSNEEQK